MKIVTTIEKIVDFINEKSDTILKVIILSALLTLIFTSLKNL